MCFSEKASIVSFLFGIFGSILCISLGGIDNKIIGYYFVYISFMQLIDYLLWRHQTCDDYNKLVSLTGMLLNHSQPIVLGLIILLLNPKYVGTISTLMFIYLCVIIPYSIPFVTNTKLQCTLKGKENHLIWNWNIMKYAEIVFSIYLFVVCGLLYYGLTNKRMGSFAVFIAIVTYVSSYVIYSSKYVGTIWCYYSAFIPILYYLLEICKTIKL
jgi:hypothetical protein